MSKFKIVTDLKTINTATESIKNNFKSDVLRTQIKGIKDVSYTLLSRFNDWYTKVIGLDEVKVYQQRVVTLQEKLLIVQEKRRNISNELQNIRLESNKLQDQLHKIKRGDDLQRYLDLMTAEAKNLQKEQITSNTFAECDREEREIFTAFTNAVRDSHEKQRAQLEYTKYFGLILSLIGSFLTFCYSTLKKQDLKKFVEQNMLTNMKSTGPLLGELEKSHQDINRILNHVDNNLLSVDRNHKELVNAIEKLTGNNVKFHISPVTVKDLENTKKEIIVYGCAVLAAFTLIRMVTG